MCLRRRSSFAFEGFELFKVEFLGFRVFGLGSSIGTCEEGFPKRST